MQTRIVALSIILAAAASALRAQPPFSFSDRTLVGFGVDVITDGDFRIPMAGIHVTHLRGRVIAPSLDISALVLPIAVFGSVDLGFGALLQTPDGTAALMLRAGPSLLGGFIAGQGAGGVVGGHVGAGLVLRVAPRTGLRLDVTRRAFSTDRGRLTWAWGLGFGVTGLGRRP